MKFLFFLLLLGVVWMLWNKKRPPAPPTALPDPPTAKRMLTCRQCGVNFPEDDGIQAEGQVFCCTEHQRLWSAPRS